MLLCCQQGGSLYTEAAAGFLGGCLPQGLLLHAPLAASMRGPGAATLQRLGAEGLGWAPVAGNAAALLCLGIALGLNVELTQVAAGLFFKYCTY